MFTRWFLGELAWVNSARSGGKGRYRRGSVQWYISERDVVVHQPEAFFDCSSPAPNDLAILQHSRSASRGLAAD